MFIHNFKYTLKTLFKSKDLIFWVYAFPLILATFFMLAFSNIEKSEQLDIMDIAVVKNNEFNSSEAFKMAFTTLSNKKSANQLFNTTYVSEKEAKALLEKDEIVGYFLLEDEPKIVIGTNGTYETILKYVVEEIAQTENIMTNLIEQEMLANGNIDYAKIHQRVTEMLAENKSHIKNISSANLSYTMVEFYTLIAMTCLYGGIVGIVAINQNLANMSNNGKRVSIGPVSKTKLILGSVLAGYITQLVSIALLFAYTIFVLHIDYGSNILMIILLALVGSLAGLSMGVAVGALFKTNENVKMGIMIAITMLWCFLSGMMGITIKYVVDTSLPLANKLNPANMITDGLYSLYYYDTLDRFYFNVLSLLFFVIIMIGLSMFSLRRQKYDSI